MYEMEKRDVAGGLLKIANHYGFKHQLCKLVEEMDELKDAIHEWEMTQREPEMREVCKEFADVTVVMEQIAKFLKDKGYGRLVEETIRFKVQRQLHRMEREAIVTQCHELNDRIKKK